MSVRWVFPPECSSSSKTIPGYTRTSTADRASLCQLSKVAPLPAIGINPWGFQALEIWQTNVTHIPAFGMLKYVHGMIYTFSTCIFISAHTVVHAKDIQCHFLSTFSSPCGVPVFVKTDNGPAFTSTWMADFFHLWGVHHVIPLRVKWLLNRPITLSSRCC